MKTLGAFNQFVFDIHDEDISRVLLSVMQVLQYQEHKSLDTTLSKFMFTRIRIILVDELNLKLDVSESPELCDSLIKSAKEYILKAESEFERGPIVRYKYKFSNI